MLTLKNIKKNYKDKKIYDNLTAKFNNGLNIIYGESGSGKTTLLKIILLLERIDGGKIYFNSDDITNIDNKAKAFFRNKKIGCIFQDYKLLDNLSVEDNIKLPALINKDCVQTNITNLLKLLNITDLKNKKVNKLSGGEQQRVAIARALINNPEILLADEPTGALDSKNKKVIMEYLKKISKEKVIIMVTHDESLKKYADKIYYIKNRKLNENV